MSKSKIYAVRVGRTTGIKMTWAECKEAVDGYAGAKYKSFPREQIGAANEYLKSSGSLKVSFETGQTPEPVALKISAWQSIQQCPLPPFKPVNLLYENADGELQLWPTHLFRKPDMSWWHGTVKVPNPNVFRYYSLIPEIPEK